MAQPFWSPFDAFLTKRENPVFQKIILMGDQREYPSLGSPPCFSSDSLGGSPSVLCSLTIQKREAI